MGNRRAVPILMLVLVFLLLQLPSAYSSEPTTHDKLSDFLFNVVGLDPTKYALVQPSLPSGVEIPSDPPESLPPPNLTLHDPFGGLVEQQVLSPKLEYNESQIDIMAIFYNGHMASLKIYYYGQEDFVYSEPQPTDILSRAKEILQRYQTFASRNYAKDTSYLVPMQNILNSIDELSPTEITEGNVTFQVTKDGNKTRIQWIYTEGGISMEQKRVSIKFRNNAFESFSDTWGLYSVSGLSVISSEEAVQIALEAAQNCELHIGHEDGETEIVKVPDLSNAPYDVNMYMVPYRYEESDLPSNTTRDPLTLYPYWQIHFYFNESIGGNVGVQVGVYGDTGEIIYCSGFGYLGASGPPNEQEITSLLPDDPLLEEESQPYSDDQPPEEQNQPNPINPSTLAVAASLVAVPIISISAIVLYRKKRHK